MAQRSPAALEALRLDVDGRAVSLRPVDILLDILLGEPAYDAWCNQQQEGKGDQH